MTVQFTQRPPHDREVSDDELGDLAGHVTQVPWDELVATSDYLSLHVPLTEDTTHLVDADVLRRMKSTAVLVNTARGPVVDEKALVHALREGQIFAAGLDVFENEPAVEPGLLELPNAFLLPHIGSAEAGTRPAWRGWPRRTPWPWPAGRGRRTRWRRSRAGGRAASGSAPGSSCARRTRRRPAPERSDRRFGCRAGRVR